MTDIITALDNSLLETFQGQGLKNYGLAELVKKGNQVHPVTVNAKQEQVAINDRWNGIFYHRFLGSTSAPDEDNTFGSEIARMQNARIRTVLATKKIKGEQFRFDFAQALPATLTVTGFRLIDVSDNITMIEDQEGVYAQEFGGGDYEKHIQAWNINAIEYEVSFISCPTTSTTVCV